MNEDVSVGGTGHGSVGGTGCGSMGIGGFVYKCGCESGWVGGYHC